MKKRISTGFFLAFGICLMMSFPAFAAETESYDEVETKEALANQEIGLVAQGTCGAEGDNLIWELDEIGTLCISGTGKMADWRDFGPWYDYKDSIINVVIEKGVLSIGDSAFYDCDNIKNVTIANSVKSVGAEAFKRCFSLSEIALPNSIFSLGSEAFSECNFKDLTIPGSIDVFGKKAFAGCANMESVTLETGIVELGEEAFNGCKSLKSVVMPNTIKVMGEGTFLNCTGLKSVTFSENLEKIGGYACSFCTSLEKVRIPDSVKEIGDEAFDFCDALSEVTFGKNLEIIGSDAFSGSNIASISFPDSLKSIGNDAFSFCNQLETLTLPVGVETLGRNAFSNCENLATVNIGDGIKTIGQEAFSCCGKLEHVIFGNQVNTIQPKAFGNCGALKNVELPDSVENIEQSAFEYCEQLESIQIPAGVRTIEEDVFLDCTSLKDVYFMGTKKAWESFDPPVSLEPTTVVHFGSVTVSFDGNGGSGAMNEQDVYVDRKTALNKNKFTRKGYQFTGWKDVEGNFYEDQAEIQIQEDTTLIAQWKKNTYTITYKLNGGKNSSKNPKKYYVTSKDITLVKATKTGYTFAGWYTSSSYKTKITTIKGSACKNYTLYAKWTVNKYTIKFNAYGGKGKMSSLTKRSYGKKYKLTANKFTRKGYTFKGWATSKTNAKKGKVKYKNKAIVKSLSSKNGATVTLYAVWKKK